jgi:hypothetical protein
MSKFSLPGSSFKEFKKIVRSYASTKGDASLSDVASLAGVDTTTVSRNNKFLAEIGLIQGGMKKTITELGKRLSRSIEHEHHEDERAAWAEAVSSNEAVSAILTTVRIKGGMTDNDLARHILYVSDQNNTSSNKTGARCIQDIFVAGGLLDEVDGKFTVSRPKTIDASENQSVAQSTIDKPIEQKQQGAVTTSPPSILVANPTQVSPSVSINIQLQLPDAADAETYERIFKALRQHLLDK